MNAAETHETVHAESGMRYQIRPYEHESSLVASPTAHCLHPMGANVGTATSATPARTLSRTTRSE